jgi:hypothetical protein
VDRWYTYINAENESRYLPAFRELLDFDYHLLAEIRSLRSRRDFLRMLRDFGIFYRGSLQGQRALLKDPFAVFSAPWFADRLGCRVVITVRHPAGFAASLQRLDWSFDFEDLLAQPAFVRDHLRDEPAELRAVAADDILGQAALLWRIVYRSVDQDRRRRPDFIVVRQEDLARDPVPGFRKLYAALGLDYTPAVERTILRSSSSENPAESPGRAIHSVHIDSRANVSSWKKRLSEAELERIRRVTDGIWQLFYSDAEWS